MTMILYVAGSWDDRDCVKKIMEALERKGFEISEDWTKHVSDDGSARYAELDVAGVKKADVLVLINSNKMSSGKYWECGMAFAWGKRIISVGVKPTTVFRHLISLHIDIPISEAGKIAEKLDGLLGSG